MFETVVYVHVPCQFSQYVRNSVKCTFSIKKKCLYLQRCYIYMCFDYLVSMCIKQCDMYPDYLVNMFITAVPYVQYVSV